MSKRRENPGSPLQRRFHRERRGRAACFLRPWVGHLHRSPLYTFTAAALIPLILVAKLDVLCRHSYKTHMQQGNNKNKQTDRCRLGALFCAFLPDAPIRWFIPPWFSNLQSPLPASCASCWLEPSPRSLDCSFSAAFTLTASSQKTIDFLAKSFLGLGRGSSNSFFRALLQPSLVLS
ncbi:hypothetical protein Y032_0320g2383 [Ancylostoma ceylanicum]|uniref:Uncharacterized protein n=1 Tax=Ancylostoma ceylanicum TaxID=53326 RepID=A0A016S169_9BILA|nr:hypothetical protein Y032_0320g2383 [Ancylostoma ceylanicum]